MSLRKDMMRATESRCGQEGWGVGQEDILGWYSPGKNIEEEQGNRNCSPQHSRLSSEAQKKKGRRQKDWQALARSRI